MAIGRSIASLFVRLGLDPSGLRSGATQARAEVSSLKADLSGGAAAAGGLQAALGLLSSAGLLYAAKEAASLTWEMGKLGAMGLRTEASFDKLARRIGESGDSLLTTMRNVSEGTVSDMALMQTTAGLLASGIQTSSEEIAMALDIAQLKAQQFGLSTQEAFERMVTGARKGSVEMLDELGIVIRAESAYKRRAEALGVNVNALTDAQRAESLWQAILADGQSEIENYGGAVEDYATSFEQAQTAVDNASMALKEALAPAVADVASALAEAIPKWVEFAQRMGEISDGATENARALVMGADAQAEYTAAVAEAAQNEEEAARIRLGAAQEVVNGLTAERDAMLEARAAGVEVYQSHIDMANAELAAAVAARDAAAAQYAAAGAATSAAGGYSVAEEELNKLAGAATSADYSVGALSARLEMGARSAQRAAGMIEDVAAAIAQVNRDAARVDLGEIGSGFEAGMGRVQSQLLSMAGVADSATLNTLYGEYQRQLEELYRNTTGMTDFELAMREEVILGHLEAEVDAFRTTASAEERILSDMNDTYSDIRSAVQSALKPTSVTAEDMGLAELGQYVEKWDESARQLDAIAERGFAELTAHPDWAAMLEIPESVLAGGEESLKAWANRMADSVRNLERPDLINIDAAVAAVQAELDRQAAVELSLDLVTEAAIEKGLVTGEDAKRQVAEALGLETALPVSLTVSEDAKTEFVASLGTVTVPVSLGTAEAAGEMPGAEEMPEQVPVTLTITDEDKEAFILALGTIPVPVMFSLGETEGGETAGIEQVVGTAVDQLQAGWTEGLAEVSWMQTLAKVWQADVTANESRLKGVGGDIGTAIWDGMVERLSGSGIVRYIIAEVLHALVED